MRFTQKAWIYNRAEFIFGDRVLETAVDDGRQKFSFSVPYRAIGVRRSVQGYREKAASRFAIALMLGALLGMNVAGYPSGIGHHIATACFGAGFLLFLAHKYVRFDATCLPLETGNTLLVFHDGQEQAILREIDKRRKADILRLHGAVDALNHPEHELRKFLWLKEEGIISEPEFEAARLKIATASQLNRF